MGGRGVDDDDSVPVPTETSPSERDGDDPCWLQGLAGSPGVAFGTAVVVHPQRRGIARQHIRRTDVPRELERLRGATAKACAELASVRSRAGSGNLAELSILDAYVMMLQDEVLFEAIQEELVGQHKSLEWALTDAIGAMAQQLERAADAYLRERGHDIHFIGDLLLDALAGQVSAGIGVSRIEDRVIIAYDLSPAETARLTPESTRAIVTEAGTRTSHTAILARALGIPAVVGCEGLMSRIGHHEQVMVDGDHGVVHLSPQQDVVLDTLSARRLQSARVRGLSGPGESRMACGHRFHVQANIELPFEAPLAIKEGAEGIGLYRTEFLLLDRESPPDEQEQYELYRNVIEDVEGRPVTLRSFDVGGDKFPALVPSGSRVNPALGLRAVRLALSMPETFKTQLRAMIRASAHGPVRIMVPLVSTVAEFEQVKILFSEALDDVLRSGATIAERIPLGCMIEVPAAALMARHLARSADFFSVGSNDLVQYTLAVDRGRRELAHLSNGCDPAVVRLMKEVSDVAAATSLPLSICGTMASDPLSAVLLTGLGYSTLSLEASAIASVRAALSRVTLAEAEEAAQAALGLPSAGEVTRELETRFLARVSDLLA